MVRPFKRRVPNLRAAGKGLHYLRNYNGSGKRLAASPRLLWSLLAAGILVASLNLVFGDGGILRGRELERRLAVTRERNRVREARLAQLRHEKSFQADNALSMERISRERYGMAAPDELIYRFEDDDVVPQVPADPESLDTGWRAGK